MFTVVGLSAIGWTNHVWRHISEEERPAASGIWTRMWLYLAPFYSLPPRFYPVFTPTFGASVWNETETRIIVQTVWTWFCCTSACCSHVNSCLSVCDSHTPGHSHAQFHRHTAATNEIITKIIDHVDVAVYFVLMCSTKNKFQLLHFIKSQAILG